MDKSKFVADQREVVLEAIRRIEPSFQPVYTAPQAHYINSLVNDLNKNVRPLDESVDLKVKLSLFSSQPSY